MSDGRSAQERLDQHAAALREAAQRMIPNRKRMSVEDAQRILRAEFAERRIQLPETAVQHYARTLLRGLYWPFLHPVRSRREGGRFRWSWQRDAD